MVFETKDLVSIGFLVVMEGLLSFDNALALAAMVVHLPTAQRKRALTYGIVGAVVFRIAALSFITYLMQATWVKVAGGAYLLFLCAQFFLKKEGEEAQSSGSTATFWKTVLLVEATDIAFSVDSIMAAVAVSSKVWIVVVGGILGIIMMRFAATIFIGLIEIFPKLERSAFVLVGIVGTKLLAETLHVDFESVHQPGFWIFWSLMAVGLASGFTVRVPRTNPELKRSPA